VSFSFSVSFVRFFSESLPYDLNQYSFLALSVELTVENLFPRTEVQFAAGYGYDYFSSHDLALHVGVGVYFACVVAVAGDRLVGASFSSQTSKS